MRAKSSKQRCPALCIFIIGSISIGSGAAPPPPPPLGYAYDTWSSLLLSSYFCTRKSRLNNCNSGQGQHTGYALIVFIIGNISIAGLHYRLCYTVIALSL